MTDEPILPAPLGNQASNDPTTGLAPPNPADTPGGQPKNGTALCLSGGGYRAMLFHVGTILRLNEAGMLPQLNRVSSVSGGSITAGVLALCWEQLLFDNNGIAKNLNEKFVAPLRALAGHTLDAPSILEGVFLPGSVGHYVAHGYDNHLFHGATLQNLPDFPRFVFNATNVQTRSLWRFSKPYMRDWQVGVIYKPTVPLAVAVAASSAFPPVLSPVMLHLDEKDYAPNTGSDFAPLHQPPFTTHVVLSDGGVYDNLGLETAWKHFKTILVSDAGGAVQPQEEPAHDWARHAYRVFELVDNQVRNLRKRQVVGSFSSGERTGAYWGIRTPITKYGLADGAFLPCPEDKTLDLALTPTRLAKLSDEKQAQLINWGYAATDAALRAHVNPGLPVPPAFPYPEAAV